jgi:hypothetical protein
VDARKLPATLCTTSSAGHGSQSSLFRAVKQRVARYETDAGYLSNPKAVNGMRHKHLGASRGKLKLLKVRAAKVPTVKQIFRNAAHLERPTDPVSNSANPCFCGTSNIDISEKVRYQGWSGETRNRNGKRDQLG